VGGTATLQVDARLLAASNRDLRREVELGRFREDLYYRLKVVHINVPPLRERRDDIPLLVHHFLRKVAKANGLPVKNVSHEAVKYLYQYDWVGNVRELENVIERAVILCDGEEIRPQDLPEELFQKRLPGMTNEVSEEVPSALEMSGSGDLLPYLGLNSRQVKAINFIKKNGYITNDYYIQINQISDRHARRDLSQLVEMELVARVGRGRSTRYVLK
jgi:two-component system NtrC family response regulator